MHSIKIDLPFSIRFRIIPLIAIRKISHVWNSVAIKSFGTDGFCFSYNENLEVGSLLDLKIDFLEIGHTTHCIGEIERIELCKPSSLYNISIRFKEIERQEKEMMKNIVEEMGETKKVIPLTYSTNVSPLSYLSNKSIPISFISQV